MESSHEDYLIIGPSDPKARRFRFSIRDLMILVVVAGLLAWAVRNRDRFEGLWPLLPVMIVFVAGMVWSVSRIFKNPLEKLTLPLVVLIGSLLWLPLGSVLTVFILSWLGWIGE